MSVGQKYISFEILHIICNIHFNELLVIFLFNILVLILYLLKLILLFLTSAAIKKSV